MQPRSEPHPAGGPRDDHLNDRVRAPSHAHILTRFGATATAQQIADRRPDRSFGTPSPACPPITTSVQLGGSVRGYQAIFVPLAALSSPGYSPVGGQPAVYLYIAALEANCPLMPPTGSSRIAAALASSSVVHAAGRPSPLAVKLIAGHGARASGSSGREAAGIRGLRDGWASGRVPGDLGRSGGRTPARTIQRTGAPKRRGGAGRCDPWSPQRRRVRLPGASVPFPAVTLSDTRVRENAHTPAVMDGCAVKLR